MAAVSISLKEEVFLGELVHEVVPIFTFPQY